MVISDEERQRIWEMKESPNLYTRMVKSVAPAVFGHEEIKRGVLLMLFGGVHKVLSWLSRTMAADCLYPDRHMRGVSVWSYACKINSERQTAATCVAMSMCVWWAIPLPARASSSNMWCVIVSTAD